jgi:hypothetical protein
VAFADHIENGPALIYYARITGLPYVFHNAGTLPSSWLTTGNVVISGETYTPSPTLTVPTDLTIGQKLQPKAGLATSAGMNLTFRLGSTWLDLIQIQKHRSGSTLSAIAAEVDVNDTSWTVDSITGWSNGDDIYAGTETVEVNGAPSGTTIPVTRARYGSWAKHFDATAQTLLDRGVYGGWISDHPLVIKGRVVTLWIGTGTRESGTFVPNGSTIESAEDLQAFTGIISDWQVDRKQHLVKLTLRPLDTWLSRKISTKGPRALLGTNDSGKVVVDDSTNKVAFAIWGSNNAISAAIFSLTTPLVDSSGTAVPDGVYTYTQVSRFIGDTIEDYLNGLTDPPDWWTASDYIFGGVAGFTEDGNLVWRLRYRNDGSQRFDLTFQIKPRVGTIWRALGYDDNISDTQHIPINTSTDLTFEAQRPYPRGYLSSANEDARLYYRGTNGIAFEADPGYDDRAGNNVAGYVRIGETIRQVTAVDADYLTLAAGAFIGSKLTEQYQEPEDPPIDVVQVLAWPEVYTPKAWLYAILGGSGVKGFNDSTYDQDWRGGSAYVPAAYVDKTAFETRALELRWYGDRLSAAEEEPAREFMRGDLILSASAVVGGSNKIKLKDVSPPLLTDSSLSVMTLDASTTRTLGASGIGFDLSEHRVENDLQILWQWNRGTLDYDDEIRQYAIESRGTYGESDTLRILARTQGGPGQEIVVRRGADALQAAFASPYALVDVVISNPLWWTVEIGDIVTLSNEVVPTISNGLSVPSPGRGVTGLTARVWALTKKFPKRGMGARRGTDAGTATLLIPNVSDLPGTRWSPAIEVLSVDGTGLILTCAANSYSPSGGTADASQLDTNDLIRLRSFDGTTVESRTVSGVSGNDVTINSATALTAPFLIESDSYKSALQSTQQLDAYQSDNDGLLDKPGGTDLARRYM